VQAARTLWVPKLDHALRPAHIVKQASRAYLVEVRMVAPERGEGVGFQTVEHAADQR